MITEAQNNKDHVRVLNFKKIDRGMAESIGFDHPYLANHGDHLTFGIDSRSHRIYIDTHRTTYTYKTIKSMSVFEKEKLYDRCYFKFEPILNKNFNVFLKNSCLLRHNMSLACSIQDAYESRDDLHIIHHLVNKMNQIDVPIKPKRAVEIKRNKENEVVGGTSHENKLSYKGYDFMNDDFLSFIRLYLRNIEKPCVFTCLFDAQYTNMVICIDFEEHDRIILWIYMPKALKACFAYYNKEFSNSKEKKGLIAFSNSFDASINKINSLSVSLE
jgi:hypothetical protein